MLGRMCGGAWRAAGQVGAVADTKAVVALRGRPRTIATLISLDGLPERILRVPLFPEGKRGLARLGVPGPMLMAGSASFHDGVARLNRRFGPDPDGLAAQGLTREEILGAALGIVQAAHRLRVSADSPQVLSALYHLLSALPMDTAMRDAFERHAQRIVDEVSLEWMEQAASPQWWTRAPSERERLLEQVATRLPALPSEARLAAGADSAMQLCLEPIHPLAAGLTPRADLDMGIITLSEDLVARDPSPQADLALLILPALVAHEKFHIEHYNALHLLDANAPQARDHLVAAVRCGLSIGTQESLWSLDPSTRLSSYLPHEKEAWALASLVIRATIKHPDVPREIAARLIERLVDTYPRFAHLMGERFAPWARAGDGVLRAAEDSDLATRDMSPADIRRRVEAFVEEPLPAQG